MSTSVKRAKITGYAHSNVRSLVPNMNAVIRTINDHNMDIYCISEIWLHPDVLEKKREYRGQMV